MYTIPAKWFTNGKLQLGPDGNIWQCEETNGMKQWSAKPVETTEIKSKLEKVLGSNLPFNEKIDELTKVPDDVGSHFWGSCQYYSVWQMYHVMHLINRYKHTFAELGISVNFGEPATGEQIKKNLESAKETEREFIRECYGEPYVRICIAQNWDVWFGDFYNSNCCYNKFRYIIDEVDGIIKEFSPIDAPPSMWLISDKLSKKAKKRLLRIQKTKLNHVKEWLRCNGGDPSKLGEHFEKRIVSLPHFVYLRDKKFKRRTRKKNGDQKKESKRKKIKCKHILWEAYEPGYFPFTCGHSDIGAPIECAPDFVQDALVKQQKEQIAEEIAKVDELKTPLDYLKYMMYNSDMWVRVPTIFKMFWPNAEITIAEAKSPKDYGSNLMNDWSQNYRIGLMCYLLKPVLGALDEDFYCHNT